MDSLLFAEYDIFSVLETQKAALRKAVAEAREAAEGHSDEEVVSQFVKNFDVAVPTLQEDGMTTSEREIDIDVSRQWNRAIFDRSQPFYIKGTEVTVHVPFLGEAIFFRVRPSSFTLSPPRGEVKGRELLLRFTFANDQPPPDLKSSLERTIQEIKTNLTSLQEAAARWRLEMPHIAAQAWQQRKQQFSARGQVIAGLGLPKRVVAQGDLQQTPNRQKSTNETKSRPPSPLAPSLDRWHAFISHASEDKQSIAKPLAEALTKRGIQVWYDEYTLTIGDSLRRKIDEGLARSQFGIVILSPAFFAKHWPQQELNGLVAREAHGGKVILPVWHNVTQAEVAVQSPILADRVAVSSSAGLDRIVEELLHAMGIGDS